MSNRRLVWIDSRYEVTKSGKVLSYANSHGGRNRMYKELKFNVTNSGYAQVRLPTDEGYKWFSVHRLVLEAFGGVPAPTHWQVNHIDGNKLNNRLANLEWATPSDNAKHAFKVLGRVHPRPALGKFGASNKSSKKVVQLDEEGNVVLRFDSISETKRHGFNPANVSAVCRGERNTHKGFKWQFLNNQ